MIKNNLYKKLRINRVKNFINDYIGSMYDSYDSMIGPNCSFLNPEKLYYVWLDREIHGSYSYMSYFCSAEEVNQIIEKQTRIKVRSDLNDRWDNIIIFHIDENTIIYPKV